MRPYSDDIRERVMEDVAQGRLQIKAIASRYRVSESWIRQLRARYRETGSIKAKPARGGPKGVLNEEILAALKEKLEAQPDSTLCELREHVQVGSIGTIWRAVKILGYNLKKKSSSPKNNNKRRYVSNGG
jgi:transposase